MVTSDMAVILARLVVILAAAIAVAPLVRRSGKPWVTFAVISCGIVLVLVPTVLQLFEASYPWTLGASFAILARLDAPGFALILFGVVLGVRALSRTGEQLRQQNQVLQREASTDFLTGLLNRRQAYLLLDYGAARARRSGDPLGFIMVDLDHFKQVNDLHGHQAGDAVLAHVGKLLKSYMRASDIVARYGGEEFLVVVPNPTHDGIAALAEDLRALIEQNPTEVGSLVIPLTASFGVATSLVNTEDAVKDSIGKADAALYAAKTLGRNQVVSWEQAFRDTDESAKKLALGAYARKQLAVNTKSA